MDEFSLVNSSPILNCRPLITCKDGTEISVQASWIHYCEPRNNVGPYTHVEIACLEDEMFEEYSGNGMCAEWTVYSYVPVELVKEFIVKHGVPDNLSGLFNETFLLGE